MSSTDGILRSPLFCLSSAQTAQPAVAVPRAQLLHIRRALQLIALPSCWWSAAFLPSLCISLPLFHILIHLTDEEHGSKLHLSRSKPVPKNQLHLGRLRYLSAFRPIPDLHSILSRRGNNHTEMGINTAVLIT